MEPKPGTKVTVEFRHFFGTGTNLRECTVAGEPYIKGYNLETGAWSTYPIGNNPQECWWLPLRRKYKRYPTTHRMADIVRIRKGWNWTWEDFHKEEE